MNTMNSDFSKCSSGKYYTTKSEAFRTFNNSLIPYGYHLEPRDMPGNNGNMLIDIYNNLGVYHSKAYITWYQMASGKYEVIGYIC